MPTMAEVARRAGVSVSTVSHVINRTRFVSPEKERLINDAIATMGYQTNELARSLIKSHDETVARTDLHRTSTADFARIRADLIKQLDQPVWVSDFRNDGWEFKGAAITNIGDVKAAHLLYTKGDASLSMMSMPVASSCGVSVEPMYQNTVDGHQVVTFTTGGEMFALVGYSPTSSLTLANVTALRDKYKNDITASVSRGHSAVAMAR